MHRLLLFLLILLLSCGERTSDESVQNGLRKTYRKNGTLLSEANYQDGKLHGISKNYYDNGNVQNLITYNYGIKEGLVQTYYKNGVMNRESTYVDGELEGYRKIFFEDGRLSSEQNYKGGLPGKLKEYSSNGKPVTSMPELVIRPINNIKTTGEYVLEVTFTKNPKRGKYFDGELIDGEFFDEENSLRLAQSRGKGYYRIKVNAGEVINQTINIIGVMKTPRRNSYIVQEEFKVSVRG